MRPGENPGGDSGGCCSAAIARPGKMDLASGPGLAVVEGARGEWAWALAGGTGGSGRRRASGRRRGTGCFLGRAFGPSERVAWAEANWAARGEGVREWAVALGGEKSGPVGLGRAVREKGGVGRWAEFLGFGFGFLFLFLFSFLFPLNSKLFEFKFKFEFKTLALNQIKQCTSMNAQAC